MSIKTKCGFLCKGFILTTLFYLLVNCGPPCFLNCQSKVERDALWPDIDLSLYQSYATNWNNIHPATTTDYWELRSNVDHSISIAVGDKCLMASNLQDCTTEFDAIRTDSGFGNVIDSGTRRYIVSNLGNDNRVWDTLDKLKEFLGMIDSKEEAILLAQGHGFFISWAVTRVGTNASNHQYWGAVAYASRSHPLDGGIREIDGEYELIVQKMISLCSPRQENRYLIRIKPSGELVILREQINERDDNKSCP